MLKVAVEDAENLFEEIEYDALKHKVDAELKPNKTKVRKFFSSLNSTDKDRKTDMKNLLERLETFKEHMFILHLENRVEKIQSLKPPSISSIDDSDYEGDRFVMHDLIVDLASFVSKEKNKLCGIELIKQARHIVVEGGSHMIFKSISQAACLHTFLCAGRSVQIPDELVQRFVEKLLKLKHLRVLCLVCSRFVFELPESIGELRHLRYLRFGYTSSIELPKSFSMLYKLQTLIIDECLNLTKLPKNFHNLISLKHLDIVDCSKLCTLSTLGQLPALETLCIEGCKGIERVGVEFYGTTCTPFASLETLKFDGLENWKEWSMPNAEAFPKLTSLAIQRCGSLLGDLSFHLPSLKELDLLMCSKLCSSLPMMPNVSKVSIRFCKKLIEVLAVNIYESFQELSIDLSDSESSIELLRIDSFPNIRTVEIDWYEDVESFLLFQSPINTLSTLSIRGCHNITLLSDNNLCCPNLTQLELSNCSKLRFLLDQLPSVLPSLQELLIVDCQELESLPKFGLPLSLRKLKLVDCYKLIASRKKWNLQALSNLISFELGKYKGEDMVSFLEQGFLPTSLTSLTLTHLSYLKTLDDKGFQELTSLKELRLNECPELETLPVKGLPPSFEGTLPPSFKSFFMESCYLLKQKYEWKKEKAYDYGASQSSMMISCVPRPQATISIQSSAHQ
ncbi:hypothetical protein F8388_022497 [Cannabis sativa]|uniref:Disease resistance R13L4/SHOC-2-like LRR domain-containing protein n=1 Tax=Cannabis sativa TaxID=3483 RepID=A0A7J6EYW5_CANSA|nr:hypothetical protein F8388_022497 [Cannabis sativa]